jgi:hypothetical protein
MSDATSLLDNSTLSVAAYASLQAGPTNTASNITELTGESGAGMSLTQAIQFARLYTTVVTSFDDRSSPSPNVARL